jgi:hypothetical protein
MDFNTPEVPKGVLLMLLSCPIMNNVENGKEGFMMVEKRNLKRRAFSYYMQAVDNVSQQVVGYLSDISPRGFRLDCKKPIAPNKQFELRLDLTNDVATKAFMVLLVRSKWCRIDELDPFVYNIGVEIVSIAPDDAAIFKRIVEKYGTGQ